MSLTPSTPTKGCSRQFGNKNLVGFVKLRMSSVLPVRVLIIDYGSYLMRVVW